jgi:endonuclease/exonuclease/phosphatase family metal-dependent hydrolase
MISVADAFAYTLCTDTTVRIMTWNLLNFPAQGSLADDTTTRLPCYRSVIQHVNPDILVTQENSGSNSISIFLTGVMNANGNQYGAGTFINGYDTDNGIFYRTSCFRFISNIPVATALRDVNLYTLVHLATNDTIRIFSCHLKSSSGAVNEALRAAEADSVRKVTDAFLSGTDFMICGDFNFYGSSEPGYQRLLEDGSVPGGKFIDPVVITGIWNDPAYSAHHTQSPRVRSFGGGITGGLDDRFDLILFSASVVQPGRVTYVDGSLTPVGNDGLHYGDSINSAPNAAVPQDVADALHCSADHLPVYADFNFSPSIGISESGEKKFPLYLFPNPSAKGVTMRCVLFHSGPAEIAVYDELGRMVKIMTVEKASLGNFEKKIADAGELGPGNYFVRMTSGTGEVFSSLFTIE